MPAPAADFALQALVARGAAKGPVRGGRLPEALRRRYGSDLEIPLHEGRPTIIANFVSTLDGVVSYNTAEAAGGGEISGFFEPDRFVMGLLRALADVVLIGAGTLRAAPEERWTAGFIDPRHEAAHVALRGELGLETQPATAVVSASGDIDLAHPGLADPRVPALIVTTDNGRRTLASHHPPNHVKIESAGDRRVEMPALADLLLRRRSGLVLCEGGPRLIGQLLRHRLVDELFLTIAPQIAGRSSDKPRLGLVEGTSFEYRDAPWAELVDLRRSGDHLFARYRLKGGN